MDEARTVSDSEALHVSDHNQLHTELNRQAGWAFGGISIVDNAAETAIAEAGTAVQVTVFDTNSPSLNCTPDHTNDHITIDVAGVYLVLFSATINSVSGSASVIELSIQKNNGNADIVPHIDRDLAGGGGESGVVSMSGITTLALNDTVELWVENETNDANYVVEDADLSVVRLGT
jgi:hypothetical protein